ncbi:MAG: manganese efflux pump family protein, partial [Thermacetogenium sp.]|nr:manganese efflux pump family protein [Thermacetogenium sp.]
DAFGAGIGLGATMKGLTAFVVVLGLVAAAMTACGLLLGQLLGHWAGKWAEIAGGLVLAGIGVRMFF